MSNLGFSPGDIIIFEATGEVCVLTDRFDAYADGKEQKIAKGKAHWPSWSWHGIWTRREDVPDPGPWQDRLEPYGAKNKVLYGMSATNLFNFLSHAEARKKGNIIKVPNHAHRPMPKENDP